MKARKAFRFLDAAQDYAARLNSKNFKVTVERFQNGFLVFGRALDTFGVKHSLCLYIDDEEAIQRFNSQLPSAVVGVNPLYPLIQQVRQAISQKCILG